MSYSPWAHKDSDTTEMKQQVKEASLKVTCCISTSEHSGKDEIIKTVK